MKVGFISLGCSKNLIDTEMGMAVLKDHNFEIVNDPKEAEIIIVNTCGFIASAKERKKILIRTANISLSLTKLIEETLVKSLVSL